MLSNTTATQPTSNFEKSKIKLQSMQLCKYISTKTVFKQMFQTLRKLQRREFLKSVNTETFPRIPTTFILCLYFSQIQSVKSLVGFSKKQFSH